MKLAFLVVFLVSCADGSASSVKTFSFENGTEYEKDIVRQAASTISGSCPTTFVERPELSNTRGHVSFYFSDFQSEPGTTYIGMYDRVDNVSKITFYGGCRKNDATLFECALHELGHHLGGAHLDAGNVMSRYAAPDAAPFQRYTLQDVIEICILKGLYH